MTVYLIVSLLAIALSAFIFFESLTISAFSLVPIAIIVLSVFQAVIFNSSANEENGRTDNTAFSTHEIDHKAAKLGMKYHALCKLAIIPLLFIFILYFGTALKLALPLIIYILSYLPVRPLVKYAK